MVTPQHSCPPDHVSVTRSSKSKFCDLYVPVAKSREIEEGVVLDFDSNNHLIGVGILDASHRPSPSDIANVNIENLPTDIEA